MSRAGKKEVVEADEDEKIHEPTSESQLSALIRSIDAVSATCKAKDQYLHLVLCALVLTRDQAMRLLDFVYPELLWKGHKGRDILERDLLKQVQVVISEEKDDDDTSNNL